MKRSPRKMIMFVALAVASLTAIGAHHVNTRIKWRRQKSLEATDRIKSWHRQIGSELTRSKVNDWYRVGDAEPMNLLRACASESAPRD